MPPPELLRSSLARPPIIQGVSVPSPFMPQRSMVSHGKVLCMEEDILKNGFGHDTSHVDTSGRNEYKG